MFHHLSIGVVDYEKSVKFYLEILKQLYGEDIKPVELSYEEMIKDNKILFSGVRFTNLLNVKTNSCLSLVDLEYGIHDSVDKWNYGSTKGSHICFKAETEEDVQNWYNKAIELGAKDNGAPGLRPYGVYYYAAFVIDSHGYKLEACVKDYAKDYKIQGLI